MPAVAKKVIDLPDLMRLWATEENKASGLDPSLIHANASTQCWWRCSVGHLTERLAISKKKRPFCEDCGDHKLAKSHEASLAYCYPSIAREWDYELNQLHPEQVTPGSGRLVGWVCELGHKWEAEVGRRVSRGADCGVCANRVLLTGFNDLATKRPDLLKEWDDDNLDPSSVLFNSSLKAQWKCAEGHVWRSQIGLRTRDGKRKGSGCGQCSKRVSRGENEVAAFIESLSYRLIRSNRQIIKPYELDMVDESLRFAVEYNGVYWHSEERIEATRGVSAHEYHSTKKLMAAQRNIILLFVWQDDWEDSRTAVEAAIREFLAVGRVTDMISRLDPKETVL